MPVKSDPRVLPRRNHHQEGPGFLFVATQGGRPARTAPRPGAAATVRERARALRLWAEGATVAEACAAGGCSRATLFRWRERHAVDGLAGLLDRPRPGDRGDLPPELELTVRLLSYWNSRRIAAEFGRRGVALSHAEVDRLLARSGTNRTSLPKVPGPRYERTTPNDLWHIDLKGPFWLPTATGGQGTCHFVALVDDHSRFLLGIRAVPSLEALPILETLATAVELCGVPHELMSDNGVPFVAVMRTLLSRFQRTLADLAIQHVRTQIDTPWTNGKIEAFWAILQAEVLDRQYLEDLAAAEAAVTAYATYYNYHRLHGELGWRTPAERYDGTPFPTAASSTSPRSPASPQSSPSCSRHESHLPRGRSVSPSRSGSRVRGRRRGRRTAGPAARSTRAVAPRKSGGDSTRATSCFPARARLASDAAANVPWLTTLRDMPAPGRTTAGNQATGMPPMRSHVGRHRQRPGGTSTRE